MLNILKLDLYKMVRQKSFYIIGIISTAFSALFACINAGTVRSLYLGNLELAKEQGIESLAINMPIIENVTLLILNDLALFMPALFAILFICSEFSNGTIKNIVSRGFSREKIFISKLICGIVTSIIYFTLTTLTVMISVRLVPELDKVPGSFDLSNEFYSLLGFILLTNIALVSVAILLSFAVKKSGIASMIFFVSFLLIIPIIGGLLKPNPATSSDPDIYSKWFMPTCTSLLINSERTFSNFRDCTITLALYTLIPLGISLPIFKKQDL